MYELKGMKAAMGTVRRRYDNGALGSLVGESKRYTYVEETKVKQSICFTNKVV